MSLSPVGRVQIIQHSSIHVRVEATRCIHDLFEILLIEGRHDVEDVALEQLLCRIVLREEEIQKISIGRIFYRCFGELT